jgi:SAM-dependent methyltransferase
VTLGTLEDAMERCQGAFDVVLLADVLEHMPAPFELVSQALRCLQPSGHIVVSVPNAVHWSVRLMIARGRFQYEPFGILDATHLRWFTAESLLGFMEQAGCTVDTVRFSLGQTMRCYDRRPWCWVPGMARRRVIRYMTRTMPGLFGWQVILRGGTIALSGAPRRVPPA